MGKLYARNTLSLSALGRQCFLFVGARTLAGVLTSAQFPFDFITRFLRPLVMLIVVYFATHIFEGAYTALWKLNDADYFTYVLLGLLVWRPSGKSLYELGCSTGSLVTSGQLASMWTLPQPRPILIWAMPFMSIFRSYMTSLVSILGLCIYFNFSITLFDGVMVACFLALSVAVYCCIGLIVDAILMVIRRGGFVVDLFYTTSVYCSGVFVAADTLPAWTRPVSQLLPLTHCLNAIRDVTTGNPDPAIILQEFLVLTVMVGLAACTALFFLRCSFSWVMTSGALTRY